MATLEAARSAVIATALCAAAADRADSAEMIGADDAHDMLDGALTAYYVARREHERDLLGEVIAQPPAQRVNPNPEPVTTEQALGVVLGCPCRHGDPAKYPTFDQAFR